MVDFNDFKKSLNKELNGGIPSHPVKLPSNGKTALLRPMKVRESKEFLKALEKRDDILINQAFDKILNVCVESIDEEAFDSDSLYLQDRTFLLIKIREISSPDTIIKITHVSNKTKKVYENIEVDIKSLQVKLPTEPITKTLSLTNNIRITLAPITRKDEKDIEKWLKDTNATESLVAKTYATYSSLIKSIEVKNEQGDFEHVNGLDFSKKNEFVTEHLHRRDIDAIETFAPNLDFGLSLKFDFQEDGEVTSEEVNIINFFMR